ncbi:DUF2505 domain-containing protein [Demequina sp.]|uniref:DUF2505 domain-containing protein n=1 Tax=Demequina sp. TaxID=2050685 RepID=UPI0025FFBD06|nr:DUF2505 domain-containing protein [Demequina sp.]
MKITHRHHFDASLESVSAMLADPGFGLERATAMGTEPESVDIDRREDGSATVMVRAHVPASSIPPEFRSFLGRDLAITYTEVWEPPTDDDRIGTFAVDIAGTPGHVAGAIGLTSEGTGTELLATGDVLAHMPWVGAMIEKAVAGAVLRAFTAQLTAADAWLAR